MATIRIAGDSRPKGVSAEQKSAAVSGYDEEYLHPLGKTTTGGSSTNGDGIYNIRSRVRGKSNDRAVTWRNATDDGDPGLKKEGDFRQKQAFSGKLLFFLAYQSLGVIYGDIGTSPLYVYSSTFTEPPTKQDLVGVLSLIIWSLIMVVTVKYILVILYADNDGEGGTFSTYALLSRYLNITNRDPREASLVTINRYLSGDLEKAGRAMRKGIETNKIFRGLLQVMGILAVAMVISDGVLTPAQSVLGAVQGISVVKPDITRGTIIGVTDAILVVLFLVQPLGISKLTLAFSPIIIIWLGFNAVFGIYNLVNYDASVFRAFNPGYAFMFLIRYKEQGWRRLGGVLLAFTGVEALFADLGAFSRGAVQLSWLGFAFPCLILAYVGQAAYISVFPEAYSNPFFNAAPPGTVYPALIIAILAAIVASQAIITATFQLLAQVMKLSYFPQLKVIHTSKTFHGQLFIPLANWLLMIGTILVASIYKNTTALGNAYGVCVMFVTFFDTCMVTLTAIFVWRFSPYLVFLPWLIIACLDGTFLSSALIKVPQGAWFTITLSGVIATVFLIWRHGKEQQWFAEAEDRYPTAHFVRVDRDRKQLSLTERFDGTPLSTINGFGMYFDKAGETTPIVFSQFILKLTAAPQIMVFFHLRPLERPSVPFEDRHTVSRLGIPNCYRLVVRYGYNDIVVTPNLAAVVCEQIRLFLLEEQQPRANANSTNGLTTSDETTGDDEAVVIGGRPEVAHNDEKTPRHNVTEDLRDLDRAFEHRVLYIIGKEQMKIKSGTGLFRRLLLSTFLWMRENSRNKMANLNVQADRVVEIGFLKEI